MYSWNPLPFHCLPGLTSSLLKGPDIIHLSISSAGHVFHCKAERFLAFKLKDFCLDCLTLLTFVWYTVSFNDSWSVRPYL